MIQAVNTVYNLVDQFTASPRWVQIDLSVIEHIVPNIEFPKNVAPPLPQTILGLDRPQGVIEYELLANAVNYCYWYGSHDIRPNDCGASKMYGALNAAYGLDGSVGVIERFISNMAVARFPLVHERAVHLREMKLSFHNVAQQIYNHRDNLEAAFDLLIRTFTTYSQDMFLKRASLFFMQLNRQTGMFKDQIGWLHVPADYQVPKMLRHYKILSYNDELSAIIERGDLIPAGSLMECEIRASTIKACRLLAASAGVTSLKIDDWLWLNRKASSDPFHLTVTTDY